MIVVDPISVPSPGMLNASAPEAFDFPESSRASHSDQHVPLGGMPRAMREAAEGAGLDPLAELYNEAIRYAQEGHLRLARERLQMLLCMAPDDGEARLTLARVMVAGQRWKEAIAALDEAQNCGIQVPLGLRRAVEDHLQAEQASAEEHRSAMRSREQGEVKALRQEARRLRSENAQLTGRVADLEREVRRWAWVTAGVSVFGIALLALSLALGGSDEAQASGEAVIAPGTAEVALTDAPATAAEDSEGSEEVDPPDPAAAAGPVVSTLEVSGSGEAAAALKAAAIPDAILAVRTHGGVATLSGEVPTFKERKQAEKIVAAAAGIDEVDASGVSVLSRSLGARHVVESGDTLSHIAYRYYGDSTQTQPIKAANRVSAKSLRLGMTLTVPPLD